MINKEALKQLKQSMSADSLNENCDIVVEFFELATPSDFDTFIKKGGQDLFEDVRSHAFVLQIDKERYLREMKNNTKRYNKFVNEMDKSADIILSNFQLWAH